MKKRLLPILILTTVVAGMATLFFVTDAVSAINVINGSGGSGELPGTTAGGKGKGDQFVPMIKTVINVMLFIVSIIAVIMIIVGGIKYTTSNGESAQVKSAKDTVLYSVIGLVVAMLAYIIVNFVLQQF